MLKVFAINGSPRQERGQTAMILAPFLRGLEAHGANVQLFYASKLKVKPCSCGRLYCWNESPGDCIFQDEMQRIYPLLRQSELLVLATPIYSPLPGDMQNFINRLVALLDPTIECREGRTRAKFRKDVQIKKVCLVSTGGWWEPENFETVIRIVKELAEDAGVQFVGPIIRPHVQYMRQDSQLTKDGQRILAAVEHAGKELIQFGEILAETLEEIQRPLISEERFYNRG